MSGSSSLPIALSRDSEIVLVLVVVLVLEGWCGVKMWMGVGFLSLRDTIGFLSTNSTPDHRQRNNAFEDEDDDEYEDDWSDAPTFPV
jgi:hypothetical protein